ncbi:TlpA family protein disulfide reductase [Leptospira wolffii]|uniref:TlpA family protein disulfide reductase n=1 Tax=Leptospira wolffii TaxID=409998 RepID=UPI000349EDBE|nr:redoxin domain-containing protein [Leptospira wolffii]TGK60059.1 TlpA family protein disulfide reductase [Leptospira wolffii]TGK72402.1 TlpA family protein disulfide reductase [Leptospira wolffii]TGK76066.1 TlpA family protein disulfide reductase [Leptospira wolffii]TGL30318.1 TlpA family protein disulfide reductase [Leptospira wolffii]
MDSQCNSDSRPSFPRFLGSLFRLQLIPVFVLVSLLGVCAPSEQSNLGVQSFEGISLEGETVRISDIKAERIALNVYGPNCLPCVKEVPVLNYLHSELQKDPHIKLYMVVDPTLFFDNPENMNEDELIREASVKMKEEIRKYGIKLPVLIMKSSFRISRTDGLVTGTPETLLLKNKPLVLYYNFIGPISEEADPTKIPQDKKVLFFKRMAGQS